jgi:hypothetical protein
MNITMVVYLITLFMLLVPGQFVILPNKNESQIIINLTHALIFGVVYHFTREKVNQSSVQIII